MHRHRAVAHERASYRFVMGTSVGARGCMTESSSNPPNDEQPAAAGDGVSESSGQPISLDVLKGAFAEMLGDDDPRSAAPDQDETSQDARDFDTATGKLHRSTDDDAEEEAEVSPRAILEAMLFVGSPDNEPLSSKRLSGLMRGVTTSEIGQLVEELNGQYRGDEAPFKIVNEADGYRMALCSEFERTRQKFYGRVRQAKLSPAAVEVLSIVVYNQPTTREEVNKVRGANSGPLLTQLVRRRLLRIDRDEEKKRLIHYSTTERFLRLFGLQSIEDMPRSDELLEE